MGTIEDQVRGLSRAIIARFISIAGPVPASVCDLQECLQKEKALIIHEREESGCCFSLIWSALFGFVAMGKQAPE